MLWEFTQISNPDMAIITIWIWIHMDTNGSVCFPHYTPVLPRLTVRGRKGQRPSIVGSGLSASPLSTAHLEIKIIWASLTSEKQSQHETGPI